MSNVPSIKQVTITNAQSVDLTSRNGGKFISLNGQSLSISDRSFAIMMEGAGYSAQTPAANLTGSVLSYVDCGEMQAGETVVLPNGKDYTAKNTGNHRVNWMLVAPSMQVSMFAAMQAQIASMMGAVAPVATNAPATVSEPVSSAPVAPLKATKPVVTTKK